MSCLRARSARRSRAHAPPTAIRVEEARMDRRLAEWEVWPVIYSWRGTFDEEHDAERIAGSRRRAVARGVAWATLGC